MGWRRQTHPALPPLIKQNREQDEEPGWTLEAPTKPAWLSINQAGVVLARVIGSFALQLLSTFTSISTFTDGGGTCYLWTGMAVAMGLMIWTPNERILERYCHVITGALAYFLLDYHFERFETTLIMSTALCNAMGQVVGDYTMRRAFPSTPLSHRDVQRLEFLTALLMYPVLLGSMVASVPGSFGFYLLARANLWEVLINYSMGHIAGTAIVLYPAVVLPALWGHRQPMRRWRMLLGLVWVVFIFAFTQYGVFAFAAIVLTFCVIAGLSCDLDQWSTCLVETVAALLMLGLTAGGRGPFLFVCHSNGKRDVLLATQLGITAAMACSAFVCLYSIKLRTLQASERASLAKWERIYETQTVQLCRVGHDFLNNATLIGGLSESMVDSLPVTGRASDQLKIIQAVITMNGTLMKDMLDSFRPKDRPCAVHRTEVDVRGLLDMHVHLAEVLTRMANKSIETSLDMSTVEGTIKLFTDKDRLHQVLINLVGNAIKYTLSGSVTLRVARRRRDDVASLSNVIIQVIDTGVGIDTEDLPKIFGDLFRCSRGAQVASGTGLGLSSVQNSCQIMGAHITAESRGVDQGSTFTLEFPSDASCPGVNCTSTTLNNERKANAPSEHTWTAPATGFRALVVDDSHVIREMIKKYMIRMGCDVVTLESGERVKEHLLQIGVQDAFDVVITDLYMGEGCCTGTDLLLDIRLGRLRGVLKDTPCILCSGMEVAIEEYGGNTFLMLKPFTQGDVSHALDAVTARSTVGEKESQRSEEA